MEILSEEASAHYLEGREHERLLSPHGRLEFERSKDILLRNLFKSPAKILDLGGGTGHYSFWLANLGYEVHLVDAMESHIEAAKRLVQSCTLASISVGDARATRFGDESFDVVLMFGPLYHLVEKRDRAKALMEANRVLKPGGKIFAVCISKFASTYDGYFRGLIDDPMFQEIVKNDIEIQPTIPTTSQPPNSMSQSNSSGNCNTPAFSIFPSMASKDLPGSFPIWPSECKGITKRCFSTTSEPSNANPQSSVHPRM